MQLGAASVAELLESLSRNYVEEGAFAAAVIESAERGDDISKEIVRTAGAALGATAAFVARRLHMEEGEFDLVLAGSLFRSPGALLLPALECAVKEAVPGARPVELKDPPVVGAVLLALENAELATGPDVHARLAAGATTALYPVVR